MQHFMLIIHLLAGTVWVGGHLLLLIRYLPEAIRKRDAGIILAFEKKYESIGLPALLLLVVSGIFLSLTYGVSINQWFSFSGNIEKVISLKLILLTLTILLAVHARIYIIPKLTDKSLNSLAVHIALITLIAVAMLIAGTFIRYGGI